MPQCQVDGITRPGINFHANTGCGVHSDNQGVEHGVLAVRDQRVLHPAPERLEEVGSRVIRCRPAQTTIRLSPCDPSVTHASHPEFLTPNPTPQDTRPLLVLAMPEC